MTSIDLIRQIILAGLIATALLDLWQVLLRTLFGLPMPNWGLVGRWFSYLPQGKLIHRPIAASAPVPYERLTGWVAHYVVGLIYAAVYLIGVFYVIKSEPTLATAVAFGVVTIAAGWFLLQPGMGVGVMARLAPNPTFVRVQGLLGHVVFGVGLYLGTLV